MKATREIWVLYLSPEWRLYVELGFTTALIVTILASGSRLAKMTREVQI